MTTLDKPSLAPSVDDTSADPRPTGRSRTPWLPQGSTLLWVVFTAMVTAFVLMPIVPLEFRAFTNDADGIRRLLDMHGLGKVLRTTLVLGIGAMVVGLVMGTVLALCVYSMTPRVRTILEFLPVLPMVIPGVAHVVGFVFLFSPENGYVNSMLRATPFFSGDSGPINVYTLPWITFYSGTHLAAFVYLFVYTGLKNLGPDYGLAARVNGSGGFRTLRTVTLPLLRPIFIYSGVVVLLLSLGQFTGPLILGRREGVEVVTTRMYELSAEYPVDYALASALGTPLVVLALILVVLQRRMVGNQSRFVGQGNATLDARQLSRVVSSLSAVVVGAYVFVAAILPIVALLFVAFSPYWSGTIDRESLTMENFSTVLRDVHVRESIVTTLTVTIMAVLLVLPVGMLIALGIYNRDRLWTPIATVLDVVANLPLTVPAGLLGFGFLFAFSDPRIGLYGTRVSLVLAYMTIMIPYAVRYQLSTLIAMGRQTVEASQASGAGVLRTFFLIIVPLSRTGIASAATVMFVLLSQEFGVSLLLRASNVNVMSVLLYEQYAGGSYPKVAVLALIITAMTAIGVVLAMIVGGRKAMEKL